MSKDNEPKIALFIDYDNIAIGLKEYGSQTFDVHRVIQRILEKGRIIFKRAYADWSLFYEGKAALHEAAIEMIDIPMRRNIGKNSADIRLVVDALDLCYTKEHIDTFVIGSGDSDFSPLVSKLKENNKHVIGFGLREATSNLLADNCDEFIFYQDIVSVSMGRPPLPHGLTKRQHDSFILLLDAVAALMRENKDVLWGSLVKETIRRKRPSFTEASFGYNSFSQLLEDAAKFGLIGLIKDPKSGGTPVVTGFGPYTGGSSSGTSRLVRSSTPSSSHGPSLLVKTDASTPLHSMPVGTPQGDSQDKEPDQRPSRSRITRPRKPAAARGERKTDTREKKPLEEPVEPFIAPDVADSSSSSVPAVAPVPEKAEPLKENEPTATDTQTREEKPAQKSLTKKTRIRKSRGPKKVTTADTPGPDKKVDQVETADEAKPEERPEPEIAIPEIAPVKLESTKPEKQDEPVDQGKIEPAETTEVEEKADKPVRRKPGRRPATKRGGGGGRKAVRKPVGKVFKKEAPEENQPVSQVVSKQEEASIAAPDDTQDQISVSKELDKQPAATPETEPVEEKSAPVTLEKAKKAPAKKTVRRTSKKKAETDEVQKDPAASKPEDADKSDDKPVKKTVRRGRKKKEDPAEVKASETVEEKAEAKDAAEDKKPVKKTVRRSQKKKADPEKEELSAGKEAESEAKEEKTAKKPAKRSSKKKTVKKETEKTADADGEVAEEKPERTAKKTTKKKAEDSGDKPVKKTARKSSKKKEEPVTEGSEPGSETDSKASDKKGAKSPSGKKKQSSGESNESVENAAKNTETEPETSAQDQEKTTPEETGDEGVKPSSPVRRSKGRIRKR